jgi:hypothetical protein
MSDELTSEPGTAPAPIPLRVELDVTITPEHLTMARFIITAGLESGIGYWARARVQREVKGYYDRVRVWEQDESVEGRGPVAKTIGPLDILNAAAGILKAGAVKNAYHLQSFISLLFDPENNDHDAETADLLIQWALFGEIVYG